MSRRAAGVTIAEALVSLAIFGMVTLVALSALEMALRQHLHAQGAAAVERNAQLLASCLRAEARCAALMYGEDGPAGADLVMTNEFLARENPPVLVHFRWNRETGVLDRRTRADDRQRGPFLVASGIRELSVRGLAGVPADRGVTVRFQVGEGEAALRGRLDLLPRVWTSAPIQGGYYSPAFWNSFWNGWVRGIHHGSE